MQGFVPSGPLGYDKTVTIQKLDIAIATCMTLPEPDPDQAPLSAALDAAGLQSQVLPWDAPDIHWPGARLTLLRSTWNYAQNLDTFLAWAEKADRSSRLVNPLAVLRWNSHKGYLQELQAAGVPVAPTVLVGQGTRGDLMGPIGQELGPGDLVIKPAVSAASYRTRRFSQRDPEAGAHLEALLQDGDALVQRFIPSVEGYGERALVCIEGEVTHAVRKAPRFEGEDESVSEAVPVTAAEQALARQALAALPFSTPLLYARVDMAPGPDGAPLVMELELLEPSLFFPQCPAALERYVDGLKRRLAAG